MKKTGKNKEISFAKLAAEWKKDPEFKAAYDALSPKFALYEAMIAAQKESGMTQLEVAERMDISRPVLTRLLSARHSPSWSTIQRFAKALGLRPVLTFVKERAYS